MEKMATKLFCTSIHTLKQALFKKNQFKCTEYYNKIITILKEVKIQIVWPVENFKNFEIYLHFVCQPASLP